MHPELRLLLASRALRRVAALATLGTGFGLALGLGWGLVATGVVLVGYDVLAEVRG